MDILQRILSDKLNRKETIKEFQNLVWESEISNDLLRTLAYDLDFYEPNGDLRKEEASFYGDERLEKEILEVIRQLHSSP